MINYTKELYPELTRADFDKYILPIKNEIEKLTIPDLDSKENIKIIQEKEMYPYHNVCKSIAESVWEDTWDINLDYYISDPRSFKNVSCEVLSQLAFSYLIRCFAEDIRKTPISNEDAEKEYKLYTLNLMKTNFREFSKIYKITWFRCNKLIKNKINAIKKVIVFVENQREEINEIFAIPKSERIFSIDFGGDTHNEGMSVAIVTFERGRKIIFKPRSVSGEEGYAKLISKINGFLSSDFYSIDVLNCGEYGFTSYIESNNEKKDMYQAGRLACLMYLLNATDMHYSNILWGEEGPVPIDMETLFHPARVRVGISESSKSAYRTLETSVYGTGILPLKLGTKKGDASVDVGFTGIRDANSSSPFKIFNILDGFTSKIKVVWKKEVQDTNALLNNKELEKIVHTRCEEMIRGFESFFCEILNHKESFMNAVTESFSGTELRYIHNMTYRYIQILRCLSDAEPSKKISIAHSLLSRMAILDTSSDKNIILSECQQLWNGDVPYFKRKFDGTELYYKENFITNIAVSAKDEFINKMSHLTKEDMYKQITLIRLAFLAKLADNHAESKLTFSEMRHELDEKKNIRLDVNNEKNLKNTINWLANSLIDSVLDDRYAHLPKTWIGPVVRYNNPGWTPGVLGYDLYAGRIGPALALSMVGKVTGNVSAMEVATDIFDRSANILGEKTYELRNVLMSGIGAFSGISGLLWALYAAGKLLGNAKWIKVASDAWELLPNPMNVETGEFFDMIMGPSASIIMRYKTQESWKLDDASIEQCILLAKKKISNSDPKLTSGLAHGLGQMLWFFSSIEQEEKTNEIKKIIAQIVSVIEKKYTDSKGFIQIYSGAQEEVSSSWCNGLAGLLLAYYEGYKKGYISRQSVVNIICQLKQIPLSSVPILCHGSLGIAEVLRYVGDRFKDEVSVILPSLENAFCSSEYIYKYFKEGKGRYPLSPGLMAGKAGALVYLCKRLDSTIDISPLTFGISR